MMAPTEILATQHFNSIADLLKETDVKVRLLTGFYQNRRKEK